MRHPVTTRPMRLIVDITVTDKTAMHKLGADVTRQLERITGVTVHNVAKAKDYPPKEK